MNKSMVACLCGVSLVLGCNRSDVRSASDEFNQLPAAAQKSVRAYAPGAEIAEVGEQTREGRTIYVVQFRDAQRYPEIEVTADGTLVKYEAGTAALGRPGPLSETQSGSDQGNLSALPVNVQKAITENAPKAQVAEVRRREVNGRVIYEVEYAGREPRPVLQVGADGRVFKKPEEVSR